MFYFDRDLYHLLLLAGDVSFISGLILMAILSAAANGQLKQIKQIPLSFSFDGKPNFKVSKRIGLIFSVGIAFVGGIFLMLIAHFYEMGLSQKFLSLAITRVVLAVALLFSHMLHLTLVLKAIKNE